VIAATGPDAIDTALRALDRGQLIVFPTDTVYGLACGRGDTSKLFAAKERPVEKRIPVLVADIADLEGRVELTPAARALADRFWPGGLTLVLRSESGATTAFRVPAGAFARAIVKRGGPLPTTSANRSGAVDPRNADEVLTQLGGRVDVLFDGGPLSGVASTIVDCTGPEPRVIREGAIPAADIGAGIASVAG